MNMTQKIICFTALLLAPLTALHAAENATINLPAFRYHGVVLEAANLKYRPHDDIIYPSVVRVEGRIAKPLGKFYLYYAPHDAPGGICLAYADRPEGPWREYANNPVIARTWAPHYTVSHVSGPDAIWSEEEGRLFLYFHGENPQTRLATSADGIHFDYAAEVVNTRMFANLSEASYGRVFRHSLPGRDNRYVMLLMGNDRGIRRIYRAWSKDGRKWDTRPQPLMDPPAGTDQVAGAVLLSWGGKSYLIAHANNSKAAFNEGYDLYVAETDAALENVKPLGKFFERTLVSPTNPGVMSPCFIEDAGRLCMFFNIGARLRNKIALAIAEPVAPLAALHTGNAASSQPVKTDVFVSGQDGVHTYRIPAMIVSPSGALLVFCEARKEGIRDASPTDMALKRSLDGGKTWLPLQTLVRGEGTDAIMNPVAVVDRDAGTVFLFCCNTNRRTRGEHRRHLLLSSRDDGQTWSAPADIGSQIADYDDTFVPGPGCGIQTQSGRLVIPGYTCNQPDFKTEKGLFSRVIYSDDHGKSWRMGKPVSADTNESQLIELADGRLMLNMRQGTGQSCRAVALSKDGGQSWEPVYWDKALNECPCQASILRHSHTDKDGRSRVLFANPDNAGARYGAVERTKMTVRISYDEAQTWPVKKLIHAGPSSYSALVRLPDGDVGLVFEGGEKHRREWIRFMRLPLAWLAEGKE